MRQLVLVILCVFVLAGRAEAATYYVNDAPSPGCSNTSGQDGSASEPWCTLGYAVTRISGGDTILIEDGDDGTYDEVFMEIGPSLSGSSGAPTIIRAAAGATPTIDGDGHNGGRIRLGNLAGDGCLVGRDQRSRVAKLERRILFLYGQQYRPRRQHDHQHGQHLYPCQY